jgi:hypothetical protein
VGISWRREKVFLKATDKRLACLSKMEFMKSGEDPKRCLRKCAQEEESGILVGYPKWGTASVRDRR